MSVAIKFENVSKQYRLGEVGTGALSHDLHRAWARLRGKPDPFAKVGQINDRTQKSPAARNPSPAESANCQLPTANSRASDSEYVWALKDINFEVQRGEILGIIGRNGAGKSTLLKLLSRVTAPTTGSIKSKGRIASLLEVGTGFHPELTGRENIFLNGAIMGMRRQEIMKQLDAIVDFSGCARYIDTPVKRYSSGMTVRLGFAVAAHLQCENLIVDEVLAVGDAEFQKKCLGKMQDVAESGRTVLFVSHNMDAVVRLCGTVLIMDSGTCGTRLDASEGVSKYMQQFAEGLTASQRAGGGRIGKLHSSTTSQTENVVPTGQAVRFKVDLSDLSDLADPEIAVVLLNKSRQRVAIFHTKYHSGLNFGGADTCVLTCDVPALQLVPSTYLIDIVLADRGKVLEHVEGAGILEVVFADFLGTGRLPTDRQGHVVLKCEWAVGSSVGGDIVESR